MLSEKLIEYLKLPNEEKSKIDLNLRKQYAFQIWKKTIIALKELSWLAKTLPDKQQEMIFVDEGRDRAELLIYLLLGLDKIEKDRVYSYDELQELLGERRFRLLAKLHHRIDRILYPKKSVIEEMGDALETGLNDLF